MSDLTLDLDGFDDWFKDDASVHLISFVVNVGIHLEAAANETQAIIEAAYDESLEERMIRDVRAAAFEKIVALADAIK